MQDDVFQAAAECFVATMAQVRATDWQRPALGVWTVRDLVGHTTRSFTTIEAGLRDQVASSPDILDAAAYYRWVSTQNADPAAVAGRGRDAGATLGDEPAAVVRDMADRAITLVAAAAPDTLVHTLGGTMTLAGYLPTRTFELTMHTLDLCRALDLPEPSGLAGPIGQSTQFATTLAVQNGYGSAILLALGGRAPLDPGLSVMI